MAQHVVAPETVYLNPTAQAALDHAAEVYKPPWSTKNVKGEFDITEKPQTKKVEKMKIFMPYEVPEPVVHDRRALEEDKTIRHFVPLSDMKWYKNKLREQYEVPERMERTVQKRQRRIPLCGWEQSYVVPLPRISDHYRPRWRIPKVSLDDLETVRPACRTPSPESEAFFTSRRRSPGTEDDYISMRRTEEKMMLEDELELGFSDSPVGSPVRYERTALRAAEKVERRQVVSQEVTKKKHTLSQLTRRRRSLSPTYIELMRPASELIRPPQGEAVERGSPAPERTRGRSPSPIRSVERSSGFDSSAHFDSLSPYEARKSALKAEVTYQEVTQTPFSLDHAPRVTVRMRSHRVPTGQNTKFTLNIRARPEAEVTWYHNGVPISYSSKYVFTNIAGVLSIAILDCQAEDSGTYRCMCANAKGEASDYGTLDVTKGEFTAFSSRRKDEEAAKTYVPEMTRVDHYHRSHFKAGYSSRTFI